MIAAHPLDSPSAPTTGPEPDSRDDRVSSATTTSLSSSSASAHRTNLSVTIPTKRDLVVSISSTAPASSSSSDTESPITILAPAPQTPRSSTFYSSASAEAASAPSPTSSSSSSSTQSSVLPPPTTWISFRSAHCTSPTSIGRRTATVKRHSSLRLCSTPPPQSSLSDNETSNSSSMGSNSARPSLRRANSVTLGRRPKYDLYPASSTPTASQSSSSVDKKASSSLGSAKPLHPTVPKPYLAPLVCRGGIVESPYFKFEIHLLHQLYYMGYIEEQVVRHVELLLSTTRPGAMHANLRAAFEWYQCHVSRSAERMMELARRVRTFASYNIYLCKIMSWNDMWIEVSSHTNEVTSQVTKNYRYNPSGVLPAFPTVHVEEDGAPSQHESDDEDASFLSLYGVRSFQSLARRDQ